MVGFRSTNQTSDVALDVDEEPADFAEFEVSHWKLPHARFRSRATLSQMQNSMAD